MKARAGFTIVEVLVAIIILSTGLLAVAAGSGSVYRMLGRGRRSSLTAAISQTRLETLRRDANRTSPRCAALATSGSATQPGGITERWTVSPSGTIRTVSEIVTAPTTRGSTTDTIFAIVECL